MTHEVGLPHNLHATGDLIAAVIDILERCGDDAHVIVGVGASRDSETQQVEATKSVFTGLGITVGQDVTDFATADTGLKVKLDGECLGRELFLGHRVRIFDTSRNKA